MSKLPIILASLFLGLTPIATIIAQARPVCPSISILADATRVTVMQSGKIDLKAEIRTPELGCTVAGSTAKARLSFWVKSAIAPEAAVNTRTIPYFVAIIANGKVIAKEIFDLKLAFTPAERKLLVKEQIARIDIPLAQGKVAEDYSVTIGFQLTEEQANYNRTASR